MELNEFLQELLYAVIIIVIPILTKYFTGWIDNLRIKTTNAIADKYIENAKSIINTIVISINQTYVDSLKKYNKFDENAQKEAFNKAKQMALTMLDKETQELLQAVYGDLSTFIQIQIETAVKENKGSD